MKLWTRIHNSLAFRSELAYRHAFSALPAFKKAHSRPNTQFSYLTLVGEKQLPMLRASLWSLLQTSDEVPRLIIAGDANLRKPALSSLIDWWPGPVDFWSAEELQTYSRENLPPLIATLAQNHVFGLKAAAIMRASLAGLTFYADTDVLWFRAPQQLLPTSDLKDRVWLQLQEDRQPAYDPRLVEAWPFLLEEPYYCAGVLVANGDLRQAFDEIASPALQEIFETGRQFSEQTTFAALQKKIGTPSLDPQDAYLSWDDQLTLQPSFFSKPWVLRHYVGMVRHIFWRDVFFLYWQKAWARVAHPRR